MKLFAVGICVALFCSFIANTSGFGCGFGGCDRITCYWECQRQFGCNYGQCRTPVQCICSQCPTSEPHSIMIT